MISHSLFGVYLNFYLKYKIFDSVLHFFGIYAFSLLFYNLIYLITSWPSSIKYKEILLIILLGISIGAVFEVIEFTLDMVSNTPQKNQLGLIDTNLDIISNILGAIMAGLHIGINEN